MKKKTLWWIIGSLIALIIIIIALGKNNDGDGIKVAVEKVGLHTVVETVTASGKIFPVDEVKISPEVSGEIIALNIAEGDSVHKGQLLVKINPAIYNSIVNQASASVQQSQASARNTSEMMEQAKSQYELALATYNRNKKLYQNKVISVLEFEQAEASYLGAKASYEASKASSNGGRFGIAGAQANLDQARENLQKTIVVAPSNGIISKLNVKLGERVVGTAQMAGTEMLTIADMSKMEVRVDVSETDIAKVKIGDTAAVSADAYRNRKFKGVVSRIDVSSQTSATTTDQATNYTVRIMILPESYADLVGKMSGKGNFIFKPGMSASVEIQTRKESNVLSVPVAAVTTRDWPDSIKNNKNKEVSLEDDDVRQVVFVYDAATKKVVLRDVKTGIQDIAYIQITNGLKKDDEVVIAPYGAISRLLNNNSKVKITKKEELISENKE